MVLHIWYCSYYFFGKEDTLVRDVLKAANVVDMDDVDGYINDAQGTVGQLYTAGTTFYTAPNFLIMNMNLKMRFTAACHIMPCGYTCLAAMPIAALLASTIMNSWHVAPSSPMLPSLSNPPPLQVDDIEKTLAASPAPVDGQAVKQAMDIILRATEDMRVRDAAALFTPCVLAP